jgi:phage tail-like protein
MAVGERKDPYKSHRFLVEIDGITQAGFREVSIPQTYQDVVDYREGNEPPTVRKLSGLAKFGNAVLRWGITDSMDLYQWRKLVEEGKMKDARKSMAIVLINEEGQPTARWEFTAAWPARYNAPQLDAMADEVAIEELEIAHEGMRRTK